MAALVPPAVQDQLHFTDCATRTGHNATVIMPAESKSIVNRRSLKAGSEIAVFSAASQCVGSTVWSRTSTTLTVWGLDAPTPKVRGIKRGRRWQVRVWDGDRLHSGNAINVAYEDHPLSHTGGRYARDRMFIVSELSIGTSGTVAAPDTVNVQGLNDAYDEVTWSKLPDFSELSPVDMDLTAAFDLPVSQRNDRFGLRFDGYVNIPTTVEYTFYSTSDDSLRLWIDDTVVVDNDGPARDTRTCEPDAAYGRLAHHPSGFL